MAVQAFSEGTVPRISDKEAVAWAYTPFGTNVQNCRSNSSSNIAHVPFFFHSAFLFGQEPSLLEGVGRRLEPLITTGDPGLCPPRGVLFYLLYA